MNQAVHPPFRRLQVQELCEFLEAPPRLMVAIFGPRQTGKTTIALQALELVRTPHRYLAVDEPGNLELDTISAAQGSLIAAFSIRDTAWLIRQWEAARLQADRSSAGFVLVLDEIQKIPNWSETVKGLWDADRRRGCELRIVILGSAPLLMQSGLNESLAGRFFPLEVTHWTYNEMSKAFGYSLNEYLYFGGYPSTADLRHNQQAWRQYLTKAIVNPAIDRDLLTVTRITKPALLRQLLETGCELSGQIVSYTKLLGQLHDAGNTTTLANYLGLLSRVGLLVGLSKFSKGIVRRRSSSPKLNVLNPALLTGYSTHDFNGAQEDRIHSGRVVESAVGAHLLATAEPGLYVRYWRDGNREVDFVLEQGRRIVAIEVKSGARIRSSAGLKAFRQRYTQCRSLVVGADGIPLEEFLTKPAGYWLEGK